MKEVKCPRCHFEVWGSDYFCFNCGYNLKSKPPLTDFSALTVLFLKSFLLPPLGIYWGWKYIKQDDPKSKLMGWLAVVATVVILVLTIVWTKQFADNLNKQLNDQMSIYGY